MRDVSFEGLISMFNSIKNLEEKENEEKKDIEEIIIREKYPNIFLPTNKGTL